MLPEFIAEHGDELIARAREKVSKRAFPRSTPAELGYGVPLFLTQLAAILRDSSISEPAMMATAAKHGEEMLRAGFTVGQVVQDYGDVCECLTDLAVELGSPIASEEFRSLNRCLDEAISAAVTEFLRLREQSLSLGEMERFAALAHEQRNLLSAAMVAYQVLRSGHVRISGRTGAVLVDAARLLLTSAVSNLLRNAFNFSRSKGHVSLRTVAAEGRIRIEVEDECGGLPAGLTEQLFRPYERRSADRTGLGLGLAISRQGVQANGGTLDVRNMPGKGCVFSINLPMPA